MGLEDLKDIEFCNMETGEYFKAIGITEENGKTVVMVEKAENDYE